MRMENGFPVFHTTREAEMFDDAIKYEYIRQMKGVWKFADFFVCCFMAFPSKRSDSPVVMIMPSPEASVWYKRLYTELFECAPVSEVDIKELEKRNVPTTWVMEIDMRFLTPWRKEYVAMHGGQTDSTHGS